MSDDEHLLLRSGHGDLEGSGQVPQQLQSRFVINRWLKKLWQGPVQPRKLHVTLFFERVQQFPENWLERFPKWVCMGLLCLLWLSWFFANIALSRVGLLAISHLTSSDSQDDKVLTPLFCGANREFWAGPGSQCGLDGTNCISGVEGEILSFRCPPKCSTAGWTYEPWPVGNQTVMRESVVVGGPDVYRGDSFICAAALHSGVISPYSGGCGRLQWIGTHTGFPSTASKDGRFKSIGFDSEFPLNFKFLKDDDAFKPTHCKDMRSLHIAANAIFILIASYFIPTAGGVSPAAFFFTVGMFGFWTVILASDPPLKGGTTSDNAELISIGFRRLLPCFLGLFFIYIVAAKPQLNGMRASLSRVLFWGGGYLIGILENYVFASLPVDRLIISDLNAQAGAWFAVALISIALFFIIIGQAYSFWLMGEFRKYIKIYLGILAVLVCLGVWPGQTLRLHHYFFALLLLPGTKPQTTCSLFFQGLLVGLFVSGVARWDFDSVLQTADQLLRGDVPADSIRDPKFISPHSTNPDDFIVQWKQEYSKGIFNGYSIVINDIERIREVTSEKVQSSAPDTEGLITNAFNLTKWVKDHFSQDSIPQKWYIRVASAALGSRNDAHVGKYSGALVVYNDGSYEMPA